MNYDVITRNLEYIINKHKGKPVGTCETSIIDMAQDCLIFIQDQQNLIDELLKENKRINDRDYYSLLDKLIHNENDCRGN